MISSRFDIPHTWECGRNYGAVVSDKPNSLSGPVPFLTKKQQPRRLHSRHSNPGDVDGRPQPVMIVAHEAALPCRSRPRKWIAAVLTPSRYDNCSCSVVGSGDVLPEEPTCRTYPGFRLRGLIRTMASAFPSPPFHVVQRRPGH
ncbi:hypothetical protein MRX96_031148 [Rhipicephalus microplus]